MPPFSFFFSVDYCDCFYLFSSLGPFSTPTLTTFSVFFSFFQGKPAATLREDDRFSSSPVEILTGGLPFPPVFLPVLCFFPRRRIYHQLPGDLCVWLMYLLIFRNTQLSFPVAFLFSIAVGSLSVFPGCQNVFNVFLKRHLPWCCPMDQIPRPTFSECPQTTRGSPPLEP